METSLKRFAPMALVVGAVALLAAGAIWVVTQQFDVYVQAALAVGILGVALAGLMNPNAVQAWLGGRQARYGGNAFVLVLAVLGIVVIANYLAARNPASFDLSQDKLGSLAPETLEALKQLPAQTKALYFYSNFSGGLSSATTDLLERYYKAGAGHFTYEAINLDENPIVAEQYNVSRANQVVMVMGDQQQVIDFASETELTAALLRLIKPTSTTVYFLTGHGERQTTSGQADLGSVVESLTKQNYTIASLDLQVTTTIPADARAIVIAGPLVPVTADEVTLLQGYLNQGGALILMLDPVVQPDMQTKPGDVEPLVTYLSEAWGINLPQDILIDFYNSAFSGGQAQPFVPTNASYGPSQITARLQNLKTLFPLARSVVLAGGTGRPEITYTPLVNLDAQAWGETDFDSLSADSGPQAGEGDTQAPIYLGLAAENPATQARIVVFGDSDFAVDQLANGSNGNANLFINSVNWAAQEESLLNLTPKVPTQRSLTPADLLTGGLVLLTVIFIIPFGILAAGVVTWFMRRRHV
jgi:ABC-type uncharacterized transport system involved in gliding motility auxiliary subunit